MSTIAYTAVYGDYLAKIAEKHETTVAAIWSHPANAAHVRNRKRPSDLYPGDVQTATPFQP